MLLCSKTEKVHAIKINSQEFYIEALFENGHSISLFGHFTNKQIEPVNLISVCPCIVDDLKRENQLGSLSSHQTQPGIRCIKVYRLTSRMCTFVNKSLPDCTSSHTRVVRFTDRDIQGKNKGFYR